MNIVDFNFNLSLMLPSFLRGVFSIHEKISSSFSFAFMICFQNGKNVYQGTHWKSIIWVVIVVDFISVAWLSSSQCLCSSCVRCFCISVA